MHGTNNHLHSWNAPIACQRSVHLLATQRHEGICYKSTLEADLVLLNTFDELDRPILDALLKRLPALYTIGPLVLQPESGNDKISDISVSLWIEETGCVKWLDCQKPYSVIYVCFGSIAVMSDQEPRISASNKSQPTNRTEKHKNRTEQKNMKAEQSDPE
jgi:hypothetical protein